jgi:hypothetical protein
MQSRWQRKYPKGLPLETRPLPAALLRTAPLREPERPSRWVWIVLGVALLFWSIMGGGYWLIERGQTPVGTDEGPPPATPAKPTPAVAAPPVALPAPQLAVGIPWLSGQTTTGSVAAQTPVPAPSQPPQLVVGLQPITGQTPADALATTPAAQTPPPAEPLSPPAPPPKPQRKAATPQASPVANPNQSSGFIKY